MKDSSSGVTLLWNAGLRYIASQAINHTNETTPVATNAARQPHARVIAGTTRGVTMAPMFDPALNTPTARARSFCGNHSDTALRLEGKLPDSPRPNVNRTSANWVMV